MAFYLRRAFADVENVFVLNGVRIEHGGEIAQMDHLILHPFGAAIVESKSVHGTVTINEMGEWTRTFGAKQTGMPSPVLQGKRQGELLKKLLTANKEALLGKMLFGIVQTTFRAMALDVFVAISDQGIIKRHKKFPSPEVCKADQVPEAIRSQIVEYRRMDSFFASNKDSFNAPRKFSDKEIVSVAGFLKARHNPLQKSTIQDKEIQPFHPEKQVGIVAKPTVDNTQTVTPICRSCKSGNIQVAYGKFGYYFKCKDCEANTPIKEKCAKCGSPVKIRKVGLEHFLDCVKCNQSSLFFSNT